MPQNDSRVKKSLLNMRVNMVTYLVVIVISFFTRRIFLTNLGPEFFGLTTTANSLVGFLNLAELGVGASIAYFLYKPLFDHDRSLICETLSIMGWLYRRIGLVILTASVVLSCFLPLILGDTEFSWPLIYYCFYGELFNALLGYFVNYRAQTLFNADQRQYLVNSYFQITQVCKMLLQAYLAYRTRSYALYVTVSIIFAVFNSIILNLKFRSVYPWVKTDVKAGGEALRRRPEIIRYVKRVFVHQIGGFINNSVMPLIIYAYTTFGMVTFYGNYQLVNDKVSRLIGTAFDGLQSSIGNLVAEGDSEKTYRCYAELFSIKFFCVVLATVILLRFNSDFIAVWLGAEYVLPRLLVTFIVLDFSLKLLRNTTDQFLNAYGLRNDIWVPLCRILTLPVMVVTGHLWGLYGILPVPVLFQLLFAHIWKPCYLYHDGFRMSLRHYALLLVRNVLPLVIAAIAACAGSHALGLDDGRPEGWGALIWRGLVFSIILTAVAAPLAWWMCPGIQAFVSRIRLKTIPQADSH